MLRLDCFGFRQCGSRSLFGLFALSLESHLALGLSSEPPISLNGFRGNLVELRVGLPFAISGQEYQRLRKRAQPKQW